MNISPKKDKRIVKERRLKSTKKEADLDPERDFRTYCDLLNSLGSSFDFDAVANKVIMALKDIVDFERASMCLLDKRGEKLMVYALQLDHPSELDAGRPIPERDTGMWEAVREKRTVVCDDMSKTEVDVEESKILMEEGLRSYVSFPLIVDDKVEGVINFGSSVPKWFKKEVVKVLRPGVALIIRALKGSRIEDQLEDSFRKMQLVDKAGIMAREMPNAEDFVDRVLKDAQEAFGHFNFVFFEVDHEKKVFRVKNIMTGFQYNILTGYTQPIDKGILAKVLKTKSAWVVRDAEKQPGFIVAPETVIKAEISAPGIVGNDVRGILSCITPYPFDFKAYEVWVIKQLAEVLSMRLFGRDVTVAKAVKVEGSPPR